MPLLGFPKPFFIPLNSHCVNCSKDSGTYHVLLCITIKKTSSSLAVLTSKVDFLCHAFYVVMALLYLSQRHMRKGLNKYVYVYVG